MDLHSNISMAQSSALSRLEPFLKVANGARFVQKDPV